MRTPRLAGGMIAAAALLAFGAQSALAQQPRTLRIAMTATDVPTTTAEPAPTTESPPAPTGPAAPRKAPEATKDEETTFF